ncbi:MAG TPA: alpha/beta fold hydrolase [Acidobacteriota bacterium]|nr:alpha/beta fold hydrolase [Acidobacteriota bacterium]
MNESWFRIGDEYLYFRHNTLRPKRRSLLFVHGLGDSTLSFQDVFRDKRFDDFNLVVPDLIGYGRSSGAGSLQGYSYDSHVARLWKLIGETGLSELTVIGHSMGGDLTTLLCASDTDGIIRKYVSVEGDLTQHDLTISRAAVSADRRGKFRDWYDGDFRERMVYESLGRNRSGRVYYASLAFCRPEAFLENARELVRRNTSLPGKYKSEIGEIYRSLGLPRVFCYGTESLSPRTLSFLKENGLDVRAFEGVGHCPMTDSAAEFYEFLHHFVTGGD